MQLVSKTIIFTLLEHGTVAHAHNTQDCVPMFVLVYEQNIILFQLCQGQEGVPGMYLEHGKNYGHEV